MSFLAPEYDTFSFVQSLLNWLGVRQNLLYNCLRGQGAKVMTGGNHLGSLCATVLLAPVLGVISLPATLLLGWFGQGSAITVCAVKESPAIPRELP